MPVAMNNTAKMLKSWSIFPPLDDRTTAQVVFEVGFASLILVMATLGNFLMILIMYKRRQLRTIPNIFVLNLSVGNFLLALTILPVFVWTLEKGHWTFSAAFCAVQGYQNYLLFALTLFTLTAISVNRYLLICSPNKYRRIFDKKLVMKIICCIWLCCIVSCSPPLFGWGHYSFNPRTALCHTDNTSYSFKITANTFMSIDIIIVLFCNVKIVKTVNAHRRKIAVKQESVAQSNPKLARKIHGGGVETDTDKNLGNKTFNVFNSLGRCRTKEQLGPSDDQQGISAVRVVFVSEKDRNCTPKEEKPTDLNAENKLEEGNLQLQLHYDLQVVCSSKITTEQTMESKQRLQTKEIRGDDIHITRTISLIVFVFCFCWLPCFVMDSMDTAGVFPPRNLRMAGIYLIFLDSVVGPFIYGIRNRKLRKAFMEVLKCGS